MTIYLPIADMNINADLLLIIGFMAGILSGLYGISGGMITGPTLIFAGIPSYIAVGASTAQTCGTAFAGTLRNRSANNIDVKIALYIFAGSCVSTFFGMKLFTYLSGIGYIDIVIASAYVVVLGIISTTIYVDILLIEPLKRLLKIEKKEKPYTVEDGTEKITKKKLWQMYSHLLDRNFNIIFLLIIGLITGLLSVILGIGGATILVPMLIYFARMPFNIASGTALFQTLLTSINVTSLHASYNKGVDLILFSTMIISSVFGVHLGAKIAGKINGKFLKLTFAMVITAICIQFILITFIKDPASLFIVE